jgi:hypothetical protein
MTRPHLVSVFLVLSTCLARSAAAGTVSYVARADTHTIAGLAGYLDIQFDAGGFDTPAQSALVEGFYTDGVLNEAGAQPFGAVTGTLGAGTLLFADTSFYNDYFLPITFGRTFGFEVVVSGPGVDELSAATSGSTFSIGLSDGVNPLLTSDTASGLTAKLDLNPDGSVVVTEFPVTPGGHNPAVTLVNAPEPESAGFVLPLLAVAAWKRRMSWRSRR